MLRRLALPSAMGRNVGPATRYLATPWLLSKLPNAGRRVFPSLSRTVLYRRLSTDTERPGSCQYDGTSSSTCEACKEMGEKNPSMCSRCKVEPSVPQACQDEKFLDMEDRHRYWATRSITRDYWTANSAALCKNCWEKRNQKITEYLHMRKRQANEGAKNVERVVGIVSKEQVPIHYAVEKLMRAYSSLYARKPEERRPNSPEGYGYLDCTIKPREWYEDKILDCPAWVMRLQIEEVNGSIVCNKHRVEAMDFKVDLESREYSNWECFEYSHFHHDE